MPLTALPTLPKASEPNRAALPSRLLTLCCGDFVFLLCEELVGFCVAKLFRATPKSWYGIYKVS